MLKESVTAARVDAKAGLSAALVGLEGVENELPPGDVQAESSEKKDKSSTPQLIITP